MKIKYERPMAIFDEFASNQFIAACGDIITVDTVAGMNCVNRSHYDLSSYPGGESNFQPANTNNNKYHTANGHTAAEARVENVFTDKSINCKTVIGIGQSVSDNPNPTSGPVYLFNNTSGNPISYSRFESRCFGAYVNRTSSSNRVNLFSA